MVGLLIWVDRLVLVLWWVLVTLSVGMVLSWILSLISLLGDGASAVSLHLRVGGFGLGFSDKLVLDGHHLRN